MYFLVLFLYYFVGRGPAPPFSVLWLRVGEGGWGWQASEILECVCNFFCKIENFFL